MISGCGSNGKPQGYSSPDCTNPKPLPGGIRWLIIAAGDIEDATNATQITDKTIQAQWQAALNAGEVEIIGPIVGDVPKATPNLQKYDSCSPAGPVNYNRVWNLKDFNTTNDNTTFWNDAIQNSLGYKFLAVDCNGKGYGFIPNGVLDVSRVIDDSSQEGVQKWEGTFSYNKLDEETPFTFPTGVLFS